MRNWKYTLNLKDFWQGKTDHESGKIVEWDNDSVHELGKIVAKRLENHILKHFKDDWTLDDIINGISSVNTTEEWLKLCEDDPDWQNNEPLKEFNQWFEELYDWADSNDVWVATKV